MNKEIFCTLGPASLNDPVLTRFEEIGVSLFRLNLSHTKLKDLTQIIQYLHSRASVPVCLDTEGAQVRTGSFVQGKIYLRENSIVKVHRHTVPGDSGNFNLYPNYIVDKLEVGDFITVDSSVLVKVIEAKRNSAVMQVLCGGEVGQNKAVTVERDILMPAMTEKDLKALAIGRELGIRHVALSFAHRPSDVDEIRSVAGEAFVISKIECRSALENLAEIALKSDALLIDRGDLSRQVPIERIPAVQKQIIARGKKAGKKVYVATNLMESMVTLPTPTRAEVNDVFNTLADGADAVVLAAESAIGKYPVDCANMLMKIIHEFENSNKKHAGDYPAAPISLLVDPHGGHLVQRHAEASETDDLNKLKSLVVNDAVLADCEQIAYGVFSPLTGFMGRETLECVLNSYRLPNGLPWPIPILLQADKEVAAHICKGERVALRSATGQVHAVIEVNDIYSFELEEMASKWFGTTSRSHPGVDYLLTGNSSIFIGGDITLVKDFSFPYSQYKLTPAGARYVFAKKGWSKVVGYYAHTVLDRAHEFVQTDALQSTHADGLFINLMTGPRILEDLAPELIYKSYQLVLDFNMYPSGKVLLGCSPAYPRYAGPREAILAAICCKNMGCDHVIIDHRDYPGVKDSYKGFDVRRLFDELGDIGVKPIFYDTIGFDPQTQKYRNLGTKDAVLISGSEIVEAIRRNKELPELYMREIVQEMLRSELAVGS